MILSIRCIATLMVLASLSAPSWSPCSRVVSSVSSRLRLKIARLCSQSQERNSQITGPKAARFLTPSTVFLNQSGSLIVQSSCLETKLLGYLLCLVPERSVWSQSFRHHSCRSFRTPPVERTATQTQAFPVRLDRK